jgi:PKD repeat protein
MTKHILVFVSVAFQFLNFSFGQSFIPTDISNLKLWLAGDSVLLHPETNLVKEWFDLSGNNNHAIQAEPSLAPSLSSSSKLNNLPFIEFDGINDVLITNNIQSGINFTGFFVYKANSVANDNYPVILNKGIVNTEWLFFFNEGPTLIWRSMADLAYNSMQPGKYELLQFGNSNNHSEIYINTTMINRVAVADQPNHDTPLFIGGSNESGANPFKGILAEILLFDRELDSEERNQIENYFRLKYAPPVNLGPDILAQNFCDTVIRAGKRFQSFQWYYEGNLIQDAGSDSIIVSKPGKYWVDVIDVFGFGSSDTIFVINPFNQILSNQHLCLGDSLIWDSGLDDSYSLLWKNNSTESSLTLTEPGEYWVEVTDEYGCIFISGPVTVQLDSFPLVASLGEDLTICSGNEIRLREGAEQVISYSWSDGSIGESLIVVESGTYWVDLINSNQCFSSDTINVTIQGVPPKADFYNSLTCEGSTTYFYDQSQGEIISWQWYVEQFPISINQDIEYNFDTSGDYVISLVVYAENGCSDSIAKILHVNVKPKVSFSLPSLICANRNVIFMSESFISKGSIENWEWEIGGNSISSTEHLSHSFEPIGSYDIQLKVVSDSGCADSISRYLVVHNCFFPDAFDGIKLWLAADSGVIHSQQNVEQWIDLSNEANVATQLNEFKKPKLIPASIELNNLPSIDFDGINDVLITNKFQSGVDFTGFFVYKANSVVNHSYPVILNKGIVNTEWLFFFNEGPTLIWRSMADLAYNSMQPGKYELLQFGNNNNHSEIYINTILVNRVDVADQRNNDTPLFIGGSNESGANSFKGILAEILLFDRELDSEERNQIENYFRLKYAPPVNLGPNILSQNFCDTVIRAGKRFQSFEWFYDGNSILGANADSIIINKPGKYWVNVVDIFGFTSSDTINIFYPLYQPSKNQLICLDSAFVWDTELNANLFSFEWSNSAPESFLSTTEAGSYFVTVTDNRGCTFTSDTVIVIIDRFLENVTLGPDTALCSGNELILKQGASLVQSYLWSDNSTGNSLKVTEAGSYHVQVTNINGCIAYDTIEITIKGVAPEVDFEFENVCKDQQMQLKDVTDPMGSNIAEWFWEIDNSFYQTKEVDHLFTQSGTFDVKLTVKTSNDCVDEKVKQVVVYALPDPNFVFSAACSGQSVEFIDNSFDSSGIEDWQWNFNNPTAGSGNTSSDKNPLHVFDLPGNYNVKLVVTSELGCIDSILKTVNVKETPLADFTFEDQCFGLPVDFEPVNSFGVAAYNWEFGDGRNAQFSSGSHFYEYWGSYQVSLAVFGLNGCNSFAIKNVNVFEKPSVMFSPLNVCVGISSLFTDQSNTDIDSIVQWAWSFDTPDFIHSDQKSVEYTFNSLGTKKVTLKVITENSCENTASIDVIVHPLPIPAFTIQPTVIVPDYPVFFSNYSNLSQVYYWDFGDGNNSSEFEPTHYYDRVGQHLITLNAISAAGCMNSFSRNINIIPANLDVAVNNILVNNKNGYLEITSELINYGSVEISDLDLLLELKNGRRLRERWQGSFGSGQRMLYTFNAEITGFNNDPMDYVCVSAQNSEHFKETNLLNNDFCRMINEEEIILFDPYPNPAKDDILIRFFLPRSDDVKLEIYGVDGKLIAENLLTFANKGLNQVTLNVKGYNDSIYLIKLTTSSGRVFVKRFVKISK